MNFLSPTAVFAFICLFFAISTPSLMAQTEKVRKIPFHGKVAAVDTSAQSITLEGKKAQRVFHLTSTTKVIDGTGTATTLTAAKVGEDVGGSYAKGADGTMTLFTLRIGAKAGTGKAEEDTPAPVAPAPPAAPAPGSASPTPAPAPPAAAANPAPAAPVKEKKQRFSGKIVSVDATAHILVVHGMTLSVDANSKLTDATGATIALSGLAAGDKISGSYLKTTGGTMTVATLKKAK